MNEKECKHYDFEKARKNGKGCVLNPNEPCRCWYWYDNIECQCKNYVEKNNLIFRKIFVIINI